MKTRNKLLLIGSVNYNNIKKCERCSFYRFFNICVSQSIRKYLITNVSYLNMLIIGGKHNWKFLERKHWITYFETLAFSLVRGNLHNSKDVQIFLWQIFHIYLYIFIFTSVKWTLQICGMSIKKLWNEHYICGMN